MSSKNFTETLAEGISFDMIYVEGGSFFMGDDMDSNVHSAHKINLNSFYLGKYPVTQEIWKFVMGNNPSFFIGDKRPVEQVSWIDIHDFFVRLNARTSKTYHLPTEAEWEYAARGGKKSKGFKYSGSNKLEEVGWFQNNSDDETKHVGMLFPNELGLYDMSGNVDEWCLNYFDIGDQQYSENGYPVRGGSWDHMSMECQIFDRGHGSSEDYFSFLGFRLRLNVIKY